MKLKDEEIKIYVDDILIILFVILMFCGLGVIVNVIVLMEDVYMIEMKGMLIGIIVLIYFIIFLILCVFI